MQFIKRLNNPVLIFYCISSEMFFRYFITKKVSTKKIEVDKANWLEDRDIDFITYNVYYVSY